MHQNINCISRESYNIGTISPAICLIVTIGSGIITTIYISALSKEERKKYDESIKVYRDNLATMAYAEEKGIAEGRAEAYIETARNLKKLGVSTTIIVQSTGLSEEEIEKL